MWKPFQEKFHFRGVDGMGVTIYDIAREANVGIGTVSRALNNHPKIAAKTKNRILEISRKLNYQPHVYAQGLAKRRTNTIAIIMPFFTNYFQVEMLQGVQDKMAELGYDIMLYGVNQISQVDEYLRRAMQKGKVDGILYHSMKMAAGFEEKLREMNMPTVLVDTYHPEFDSITVQNEDGAYVATKHLIKAGYRKIGMLNASMESEPARMRYNGYRKALDEARLTFNDRYFKVSKNLKNDGFNREAGYQSMMELIDRNREDLPDAVFISSDIQAIGALNALRDRKLSAPEDIAIIGYDDIELAKHLGLTTMRQPMYQMGVLAVEKIFHRIQNNDFPPSHTTFSPTLVVRETCGMEKQSVHA